MRVLIDTSYAARAPLSGTGVYIRKLCEQLERSDEVELIQAVDTRRRPPAGGGLGSLANLATDLQWQASGLPRLAARHRVDLVHHPLPARARLKNTPQVVTVVDLAFERLPQCFERRFRIYAQLTHRWAARRADAVVCVSETTAADVQQIWGVPRPRLVAAPLGPGQEPDARRATLDPGSAGYFLYVGDAEPRKNLGTLLDAYAIYRSTAIDPLPLVLAGSAAAAAPGVRVEESPSWGRLAELYAGAAALIQPSLYEGFGLTTLEAMHAGTPVLAARSPGLIEVCDAAVLWADPREPRSFAEAMTQLAAVPELRRELAEHGRERAATFSWERCAEAHVRAYSLAVATRAGRPAR